MKIHDYGKWVKYTFYTFYASAVGGQDIYAREDNLHQSEGVARNMINKGFKRCFVQPLFNGRYISAACRYVDI